MSVTTLLFTKNNPNLLADTMSLGKKLAVPVCSGRLLLFYGAGLKI